MRFTCLESCGGKCCTGDWSKNASFVYLTQKDLIRLRAFLNQPYNEFAQYGYFKFTRFTDKLSRQWFLKDSQQQCRFFVKGKCTVYEARPTQCRTFPFWPELMVKGQYAQLKKLCPGVGKGDDHNHALLVEQTEADKELCNNQVK